MPMLPSEPSKLGKLGIGAAGIKTTPLSGEPDLLRGPSPEADRLIQTSVDDTYRRFLELVATAMQTEKLDTAALAAGLTELANRLTGNGANARRASKS